ncbi:hypothetical protein [Pontibacter mangrovi]|uniref:PepSY domain-containing protein n=1 Tax=Pontibacter mangrovi TaxID=2589816 RepID=A0A501WAR8_9BACT|nr:hypothetical protein [Pontibacter mangrovi]TPE45440.1 hypothetical protein FJM65_05270 [Pontibacter mangrovi]
MKKVSVLAVALAFAGFTAQAQETATQPDPQAAQQEQAQGKQKITVQELPDAVKKSVSGDAYKDLTVGEVHKVEATEAGAPATYEVQFLDANAQPTVVRFDETGKKVEG